MSFSSTKPKLLESVLFERLSPITKILSLGIKKELEKELTMNRIGDTSLFYNKIHTLAENKFEEICMNEMNRSWEKLTELINHHERISSAMKESMIDQLAQFRKHNLSEKKG